MIYHLIAPHVFAEILFEMHLFFWSVIFGGRSVWGQKGGSPPDLETESFSNKGREGSAPNAAATADANHPVVC